MIDYNQPWGWTAPAKKKANNMVAPLGSGDQEVAPSPIAVGPSMEDKLVRQVGGALAVKAIDSAAKGASEYVSGTAAPVAASAGDTLVGGVGNAAEMTGNVSDAAAAAGTASSGLSALGPLGAAIGGAMKGEYDQAAGAALGSALGSTFGPLGAMVGSKLGGYAGDAVGGLFGLADGTTKVPDDKSKGIVQSIWDRMVNSGREAMEKSVKTATGNDGGVGQAKQALVSRKERLDAEERKAMGYAWGTTNAGGKGFPATAVGTVYNRLWEPNAATSGGTIFNRPRGSTATTTGDTVLNPPLGSTASNTVLNRPWGSTAATGYYGDRAQSSSAAPVTYRPHGFTTSLPPPPQPQAVPIVQTNTGAFWNAAGESGSGGAGAGGSGGSGDGGGGGGGGGK